MSTTHQGSDRPSVEFDQEVRFAVVMYGGSSLAIYINGVAQELLRLVRATAPRPGGADGGPAHLADRELSGSERVYRRLGRMLGRQGARPLHDGEDGGEPSPIRTRFVVDILTGTSAGGINAVFLAKALANDQEMDELKQLWVSEGDIAVLINDADSYKELKFTLEDDPGEPWSVLNSRRMLLKLLTALRGMDKKPACAPGSSPLVDELDLFVTATDLPGRVLQLRLADGVVSEYKHRSVFQFRYRSQRASDIDRSDFGPEYNAFLAFAARATSAHQAAFSPVKLDDVTPIAAKYEATGEHPASGDALRAFYQDYLLQRVEGRDIEGAPPDPDALARAFREVWFVDGGTLDNKPFSFVVEQLPLRHAETFVDRKLLYVEPSPEHLKWVKAQEGRPRIAGNVAAALSSLPRYETIVEDLTRLLERNRLVERLDHIMRGMEKDLRYGMRPKESRTRDQLRALLKDKEKMLEWMMSKGAGWGSYHRLRVAEVTDDMTLLVARAAGFSEKSDEFISIRNLVRAWRAANFDPHMEYGKRSEVEFLLEFDLLWALRRVGFVIKKLNDLACLDEHAQEIARVARVEGEPEVWPREAEKGEFRRALLKTRQALNEALVGLRGERRKLWARDDTNPFRPAIAALEVGSADLLELLREPTDEARRARAVQLLGEGLKNAPPREPPLRTRRDAVEALTEAVKAELERAIKEARIKCSKALRPPEGEAAAALPRWELFLRQTLWYYYIYFDEFDQISYPILYSTGVGEETDVIDVFRVSPEDATALIDESKTLDDLIDGGQPSGDKARKAADCAPGECVKKLAGTTLGNFGAFFRREFRVNDIMWGRLDGAERVIAALLPAHKGLREEMTAQAHRAIIVEEVLSADKGAAADKALQGLVWDALDVWDDVPRRKQLLSEAAQGLPPGSPSRDYLEQLAQGADPRELFREAFVRNYKESKRFEGEATVSSAKRANRVLGDMALGYFPAEGRGSRWRRLVMLLGRRLRIFVEAAIVPEGEARRVLFWRLVGAYLISLLILTLICLPAFVLMRSAEWPWPALGFLFILLVTLPLALLPLLVTAGYNLAWLKLKEKLDALLPRAARAHEGGRAPDKE